MKLFQKRKDFLFAVLLVIVAYPIWVVCMFAEIVEMSIRHLIREASYVTSPFSTFDDFLAEMRYRRARRQARRNQPELNWD